MNTYSYVGGNPVNWFDSEGLFRLSKDFRKRFPKSSIHIDILIKKLTPRKMRAFLKWGGCYEEDIINAFTKGKGPIVIPSSRLGVGEGEMINYAGNQNMSVGYGTFINFENGEPGSELTLQKVIEHETVHYLNLNGPGDPYPELESGNEYEKQVYGKTIDDECSKCKSN